jgi:hypothetical protein
MPSYFFPQKVTKNSPLPARTIRAGASCFESLCFLFVLLCRNSQCGIFGAVLFLLWLDKMAKVYRSNLKCVANLKGPASRDLEEELINLLHLLSLTDEGKQSADCCNCFQ